MLWKLILLFVTVPFVELVLLLTIGQKIGLGPTIGIILLTGIVGAWLARREGTRAWGRVRRTLAAGKMPARELVDGIMIFVAGALLLTPGFLTDAVGFAVLIAPVRDWLWRHLKKHFETRVKSRVVMHGPGPWQQRDRESSQTVEGKAIRVEDVDEDEADDGQSR